MCEAGSDDDEDVPFGGTWGLNVRDQDSALCVASWLFLRGGGRSFTAAEEVKAAETLE